MTSTVNVLGVTFLDESVTEVISKIDKGGLLVVPSGPGMSSISSDPDYATAVQNADFAIADSGFMCLCLRLLGRKAPRRVSGLELMKTLLLNKKFLNERKILWVLPSDEMVFSTKDLLQMRRATMANHYFEVASFYKPGGPISDLHLLRRCSESSYDWIVIAIAGGKQEKLGAYLRSKLPTAPTIICIGAALAFETGDQVYIPTWADRLYLGWLIRILSDPKLYIPRYRQSLKLMHQILQSK